MPSNQRQDRDMDFRAASYDESANTVDIIYSSGARVDRGDYVEELVVSDDAISTTRLDAGAVHLIRDHMPWGAPVGRVVSHRIEGNNAIATVKLSESADFAGVVADIKSGVMRSVSVGYYVRGYEDLMEDGVTIRRVTSWEPAEISLTVLPADPDAQIRSMPGAAQIQRRTETQIENPKNEGGDDMPEEIKDENETAAVEQVVTEPAVTEAPVTADVAAVDMVAERSRASEIMSLSTRHAMPADFATRHITGGTAIADVHAEILTKIAERSVPQMPARSTIVRDERETLIQRAENAIVSRMTRAAPSEDARELRNLTLVELARRFVTGGEAMNRYDVVREAFATRSGMHSTSDFSHILGAAGSRTLRAAYDAAPRTFGDFVREVDLPDFRSVERVSLGDAPNLEHTPEGAEVTYGTLGDNAETYKLATYRKAISFSRQAIINDDLSAFSRLNQSFGASAARTESGLVYDVLTGNRKMSDGKVVFIAAHGNSLTDALDVAGLAAARSAMRKQKSAEGNALDLAPAFLVVGPDLETDAQKLLSPISATLAGDVNPFATGSLKLIVDSRIEGTTWFLIANPATCDTIEVGYLDGQRGVQVETHDAPDLDGVKIMARLDVAAAPIDWRGMTRSTGAGS